MSDIHFEMAALRAEIRAFRVETRCAVRRGYRRIAVWTTASQAALSALLFAAIKLL